jgi:RHS repeat-associated protein
MWWRSYGYDVFGAIRVQTGTSENHWLFTGEQRDSESGLYYLRARYYDPETGRFLTADPFPGYLSKPLTHNSYIYALSNPCIYVDPTGYASEAVCKFRIQGKGIGRFKARFCLLGSSCLLDARPIFRWDTLFTIDVTAVVEGGTLSSLTFEEDGNYSWRYTGGHATNTGSSGTVGASFTTEGRWRRIPEYFGLFDPIQAHVVIGFNVNGNGGGAFEPLMTRYVSAWSHLGLGFETQDYGCTGR